MMRTLAPRAQCATAVLLILVWLSTTAAAGPAAAAYQGDAQVIAEVQAAYQKFRAARSFRSRISVGGFTQTTEYVAPDRYRIASGEGQQAVGTVIIGQDMWQSAGGACLKRPNAGFRNPREAVEHPTDAKITVARGGPEVVEGTATQTYNLTIESQGRQARQKLYVATGTGYIRRIEVSSDQGAATIDYLDYDTPITINPPC